MSVEPAHQQSSGPARGPGDGDSDLEIEDSLSLYFRGVGRTPRLSRAQERELFRRKDAGDDRAKRLLIEANLRLVIWIARQYATSQSPSARSHPGREPRAHASSRTVRLSVGFPALDIRHAVDQACDRAGGGSTCRSRADICPKADSGSSSIAADSPAAPESRAAAERDRRGGGSRLAPPRRAPQLRTATPQSRNRRGRGAGRRHRATRGRQELDVSGSNHRRAHAERGGSERPQLARRSSAPGAPAALRSSRATSPHARRGGKRTGRDVRAGAST